MWNNFHKDTSDPYLCFLNNDVRIARNFVKDTVEILDSERSIGAVVHATNHPEYCKVTELNYAVFSERFVQGWDFTLRREAYVPIPSDLAFFGGDDWLFYKMYCAGWNTAHALSSPVIHYNAKSRKYYPGNRAVEDAVLKSHGIPRMSYNSPFTKRRPTFTEIIDLTP